MLTTPKSLRASLITSLSVRLDTELSAGHLHLQVWYFTQWVPRVFSQKPSFSYVAYFHSESLLNWSRASPLWSHSTRARTLYCNGLFITVSFRKWKWLFNLIFNFREWGRMKERNTDVRNTDWLPSIRSPTGDLISNPGFVPWLGIQSATFQFVGWRLTNWTTLARASW